MSFFDAIGNINIVRRYNIRNFVMLMTVAFCVMPDWKRMQRMTEGIFFIAPDHKLSFCECCEISKSEKKLFQNTGVQPLPAKIIFGTDCHFFFWSSVLLSGYVYSFPTCRKAESPRYKIQVYSSGCFYFACYTMSTREHIGFFQKALPDSLCLRTLSWLVATDPPHSTVTEHLLKVCEH